MNKLVITHYKKSILTALFDGKTMLEASCLQENVSSNVGNIYVGRIENIVPSINAAFVEYTKGEKGYLSLNENPNPLFINKKNTTKACMGDLILVQVERDPVKTKAAVLTTHINLPGKYAVLVDDSRGMVMISDKIKNKEQRNHLRELAVPFISDNCGIVLRTNSKTAGDDEIQSELKQLLDLHQDIHEKALHRTAFSCLYKEENGFLRTIKNICLEQLEEIVTDDENIFAEISAFLKESNLSDDIIRLYKDPLLSLSSLYSIDQRMKEALGERVWLKSGGYLIIQPTEALVVIDVNTGKFSGNKKDREQTFYKINLEAAIEIAHQIRLRNYSGIILIDFIDMELEENKTSLIVELKKAIARDPVKTTYVDMTGLGLVELTRKKIHKSLQEQVTGKE